MYYEAIDVRKLLSNGLKNYLMNREDAKGAKEEREGGMGRWVAEGRKCVSAWSVVKCDRTVAILRFDVENWELEM